MGVNRLPKTVSPGKRPLNWCVCVVAARQETTQERHSSFLNEQLSANSGGWRTTFTCFQTSSSNWYVFRREMSDPNTYCTNAAIQPLLLLLLFSYLLWNSYSSSKDARNCIHQIHKQTTHTSLHKFKSSLKSIVSCALIHISSQLVLLCSWLFLCLYVLCLYVLPSVLWHCWLGVRKSIQSVKNDWWDVGVVICLEQGADCLHMVQLMPLQFQNPIIFRLI